MRSEMAECCRMRGCPPAGTDSECQRDPAASQNGEPFIHSASHFSVTREVTPRGLVISKCCRNRTKVIENIGAGEGNRTLVFSLEGCCSTIELHPRLERSTNTPCRRPQPPRNRSETIGKPPGTRQSWPGHLANRPDSGRNQRRSAPLTPTESLPILMSPQTTKGGDPVSLTKRCHLAGIAR